MVHTEAEEEALGVTPPKAEVRPRRDGQEPSSSFPWPPNPPVGIQSQDSI